MRSLANPGESGACFHAAMLAVLLLISVAGNGNAETVSLHDCLTEAMGNNPLLKESNLGVMAGDADIAGATGRHFPRISLDANYINRQDPFPYIPAQSAAIPAHFSDEFASWQGVLTVPLY